jgi:hypothetical protein
MARRDPRKPRTIASVTGSVCPPSSMIGSRASMTVTIGHESDKDGVCTGRPRVPHTLSPPTSTGPRLEDRSPEGDGCDVGRRGEVRGIDVRVGRKGFGGAVVAEPC